jgi:ArsR family transcriptional regulator, arsenate/arsenite/antimonite-responsive transcriptional repressor
MKTYDLSKIFKALSNEQRLHLFMMLYEWCGPDCSDDEGMEKCFTKACCTMNLSRSTISHHFKELQNAGLITCTRNGQSFLCQVNVEAVEAVRSFMK